MERSLSMELVRVTEAAALSSARWMGRGLKMKPMMQLQLLCAMCLIQFLCRRTVVIGEGEMDEAPMLYIGEKLGTGVWSIS